MKHTNDVNNIEEGQNVNTLSEIEEYYKAREQQLLKKLHRQEAALAAAEQTLKRLTENQKAPMDETTEQRTAQEQAFKEKLYRDPLTGIYNRRYYEEVVRKSIGPAGIGGPGGEFTGGGLRCSNGGSVRRTRNLEGPRPERHRHLDFAEHERTRLGGKPQNLPRLLVLENDGAFGKNDSKAGHSDRTS